MLDQRPYPVSINTEGGKDKLEEQKVPLIQQINEMAMVSISYLAGTIDKDEMLRFKKMVFRASRGKAITYNRDLDALGLQDYTGAMDHRRRTVYVIVFQDTPVLKDRLVKICESFMGKNFEIPHGAT